MLNSGYTYIDKVARADDGKTVLEYYTSRYSHSTEVDWRERIMRGYIRADSQPIEENSRIRTGQRLTYFRQPWNEPDVPHQIEVLHEDAGFIVFNKPSGLPVLPGGGFLENTMLHIARKRYDQRLSPVHRLGRGTSGAILFTKTKQAAIELSRAMRERRIKKSYLALVDGTELRDEFSIDYPIGAVSHPLLGSVYAASPDGKPSLSHCFVLKRNKETDRSLVLVDIVTGRPHQVRIHMAFAGYPLTGDPLYSAGGRPKDAGTDDERNPLPGDCGYLLHSWRMVFQHPETTDDLSIVCDLPWDVNRYFP